RRRWKGRRRWRPRGRWGWRARRADLLAWVFRRARPTLRSIGRPLCGWRPPVRRPPSLALARMATAGPRPRATQPARARRCPGRREPGRPPPLEPRRRSRSEKPNGLRAAVEPESRPPWYRSGPARHRRLVVPLRTDLAPEPLAASQPMKILSRARACQRKDRREMNSRPRPGGVTWSRGSRTRHRPDVRLLTQRITSVSLKILLRLRV